MIDSASLYKSTERPSLTSLHIGPTLPGFGLFLTVRLSLAGLALLSSLPAGCLSFLFCLLSLLSFHRACCPPIFIVAVLPYCWPVWCLWSWRVVEQVSSLVH